MCHSHVSHARIGTLQRKELAGWGIVRSDAPGRTYWFGAHSAVDFDRLEVGDAVTFVAEVNHDETKALRYPHIAVDVQQVATTI